jgi:transposase
VGYCAAYESVTKYNCRRSVKEYQRGGIDALYWFNYGTNKSQLETHAVSILQSFTEKPPRNAREAKSRIEKMTGIKRSPTQIRAFMKRHKLRYIKMGHIPAKANTEQQKQWVETTLTPVIKEAQKGECHLYLKKTGLQYNQA